MISNKNKSEFLGMPWGTANNRLRKQILFHLLKKYKENFCYRCDKEITNEKELSTEHKLPWQNVSIELFWDLGNIAFSHLTCNVGARTIKNQYSDITHCKRGHEFTEENISKFNKDSPWRRCKQCRFDIEYPKRKRKRKKEG